MLRLIRYWLPAAITLGGILVMVIGGTEDALLGGAGIVGAGLSVWLLNILYRLGVRGDRERDEEDAARAFFDSHGYWPDEAPPPRRVPQHKPPTHARRPAAPPHRRP
jgi:hypothetical protein